MNICICPYEDWMKQQVIDMFCNQYNILQHHFNSFFDNFYEASFQKEKGIRIVALDRKKVVGFQSFFYWPYEYNQKILNSYQSGNSLVHPEYRGKGIFQLLLNYIYENNAHMGISFLMGFPVEASRNSFIRNNFHNILDLKWHIKVLNPLNRISIKKRFEDYFQTERTSFPSFITRDTFRLSCSEQFLKWRDGFTVQKIYYPLYQCEGEKVQFEVRVIKRKKFITELIIGDVRSSSSETELLTDAFHDLFTRCRKCGRISIISIALNNSFLNPQIKKIISKSGFKKINKKIYFIVKAFSDTELVKDPAKWELYRNDIDTW